MAKRRAHGEGSVFLRTDGRWQAQMMLETGKRKYFYGKTKKEALDKLHQAQQEQRQGNLATSPQQKLETYLNTWLETVFKPTARANSYRNYRSIIKAHLVPALGHISLQKLTTQKLQAFYAQKLEEGLAPGSISLIHALLHSALENAIKWKLVSHNVATHISLPRGDHHEMQVLTSEQARTLLQAAKGHRLETLLTVALTTGMRRGEILGLRWNDVDFDKGIVHVRRTMSRIPGRGYVENDPKTKAGRRKIALSEITLSALKEHRIAQEKARLDMGDKWHEQGLVFPNIYGGFLSPDHVLYLFYKLLDKAGLPKIRFHDLRHTAATFWLTKNVHPKVVQEALGHSSITMTMDTYSHVLPSLQQDAANKMNDVFKQESE